MDVKKALLLGALAYAIPFVVTNSAALLFSIQSSAIYATTAIIITIAILVLLTLQYFKGVQPSLKEGLLFGFTAGIIGIVIDTAIKIASFYSGYSSSGPFENLTNPAFYGAVIMVIILAAVVGFIKSRQAR